MILRAATPADRAGVVTLAMHFHAATTYSRLLAVDPDRVGVLFDLARLHGIILVAEQDNVPAPGGPTLIGFLALVSTEHMLSGDRYAEEVGWWVEPGYRHGTLGPRLFTRAEAWARDDGCAFIKMAAPVDSEVGTFYVRQGYQPIETAYMKRLAA